MKTLLLLLSLLPTLAAAQVPNDVKDTALAENFDYLYQQVVVRQASNASATCSCSDVRWDGRADILDAGVGRASLGLGTLATRSSIGLTECTFVPALADDVSASTASLNAQITALGVSTGALAGQAAALSVSTAALSASTTSLRADLYASTQAIGGQIDDLYAVTTASTDTLRADVTALWVSTGTLAEAVTQLNVSTAAIAGTVATLDTSTSALRVDLNTAIAESSMSLRTDGSNSMTGQFTTSSSATVLGTLSVGVPMAHHGRIILSDLGTLGIGVEQPSESRLTVTGVEGLLALFVSTAPNVPAEVRIASAPGTDFGLTLGQSSEGVSYLLNNNSEALSPAMLLSTNNYVGIGLSTEPQANLHLAGTFRFEDVSGGAVGDVLTLSTDRNIHLQPQASVDLSSITSTLASLAVATTTLHTEPVEVSRIDLSTVTAAISVETSRAQSAEAALSASTSSIAGALAQEVVDRAAGDAALSVSTATNAAAISAENSRAVAAEASIAVATTTLHTEQVPTSRIDLSTVTTAISEEASRAQGAEFALSLSTATNASNLAQEIIDRKAGDDAIAIATTTLHIEQVPISRINLSTVTTSINAMVPLAGGNMTGQLTTTGLGVGTTSPAKKLHIHSTSADNHLYVSGVGPNVYLSNSETVAGVTQLGIAALATTAGQYGSLNAGDFLVLSNHDMYLSANYYQPSANDLILQPTSGPGAGGNVGIGTVSPSQALDVTGNIKMSGDIIGKTDGSNAAAGGVGEYKSAYNYSPVSLTGINQWTDGTSLSLTAGDWMVYGEIWTSAGGASGIGNGEIGFGTSSGNNAPSEVTLGLWVTDGRAGQITTMQRMVLTTTTTVYLKALLQGYTGGPPTIFTSKIKAWRVR